MDIGQINIVLPVYNEEGRIREGLDLLLGYLALHAHINYIITIVDNASTDKTSVIAKGYCETNKRINYIRIEEKGLGIAFRRAVENNKSEFVGYMDIDMSTELNALNTAYKILTEDNSVDIVNASRYSKGSTLVGRSIFRNIISYIWVLLLKITLSMKSSDSICGFKFFRGDVIRDLMEECNQEEYGWFLIIEVILRAEKAGYHIFELPVKWVYNDQTKVRILRVAFSYLKGIMRLKQSI